MHVFETTVVWMDIDVSLAVVSISLTLPRTLPATRPLSVSVVCHGRVYVMHPVHIWQCALEVFTRRGHLPLAKSWYF